MGIITIFGRGFRETCKKAKMLLFLYLAHFFFSLLIIAPFYFLLQKDFSRSILGEKMFQGMDLLWIGDLIYKYQNISSLLAGWLLVPFVLFVVLQIFLNGAILGRIAAGENRMNLPGLLSDGGRYFGRFSRVFLLSLMGYLFIIGLIGRLLAFPFKYWLEGASTQWTTFYASSLRFLLLLLLISIVKMFFDYVKVRLVAEDSRKALRAFLLNFAFLGKRFFKAWALFLLVGLLFLVFSLTYLIVARWIPGAGAGALLILFLWQQAYIVARLGISILFLATEYQFFRTQQPVQL
jgi:hypothetical protein